MYVTHCFIVYDKHIFLITFVLYNAMIGSPLPTFSLDEIDRDDYQELHEFW